jgi:outer membrane protein
MIRRLLIVAGLACWPVAAAAQSPLSLPDAIARARAQAHDARALAAAEAEARHRVTQARAGYLPRVDVTETWQRGDQPVFVFSSLLAQRVFTSENFAVDALNFPPPVSNFRVGVTAEQPLFDPALRAKTRVADLGEQMASAAREQLAVDLGAIVSDTYGRVVAAIAARRAADASVISAEADLRIARDRRDAGRVTEADVLLVEVHIARARERRIRAAADENVARAALNQLIGEPLDAMFVLDDAPPSADAVNAVDADAAAGRADVRLAGLRAEHAEADVAGARAAFLPQVSLLGGWEANGGRWDTRASSWIVGVTARVNVFRGFADHARLAETRKAAERRAIERDKADALARLDIRAARARLDAAVAAAEVGSASALQARESRRIIRDRYEAGLADVGALLRAADAVSEAEALETRSRVEVLVARASLARALGKL